MCTSKTTSQRFHPAERCLLCGRSVADLKGYRIVAQKTLAIYLSKKKMQGGDKDYPEKTFMFQGQSEKYIVVRGKPELWTNEVIARATAEFTAGKHPWFCQVCANRVCSKCGSPINYPLGSDIIYDNGNIKHIAILPFKPGCSNRTCYNYQKFEFVQKG
jgi:hypothetical protein